MVFVGKQKDFLFIFSYDICVIYLVFRASTGSIQNPNISLNNTNISIYYILFRFSSFNAKPKSPNYIKKPKIPNVPLHITYQ